MKRKWHHPEAELESGKRVYWRSYDELQDTPEFREWLEREFPRGAAEVSGSEADENTRRSFLKYMGASASLAGLGLAGCRRPDQFIIPFNKHVEEQIPGRPLYYSSARPVAEGCIPLVVTTYEGRPTKVEGNRLHPEWKGGSDVFTQASILDLYDPDRSAAFRKEGEVLGADRFLEEFEKGFLEPFRAAKGAKSALLVGASTSPTRDRLISELFKVSPGLQVFEYEPLLSLARRQADARLWGDGVSAVPVIDKADRILALDADFLGLDPQGESSNARWAARRSPGKAMARLYVVEPAFTLTGGVADHRMRLASSQVIKFAVLLAEQLGLASQVAPLAAKLGLARELIDAGWVKECAADLQSKKGRSLVLVGSRQPVEVHQIAGLINQALGAIQGASGPLQLVRHGRKPLPGIESLAAAIRSGAVENLVVTTPSDPLYDAPASAKWGESVAKLKSLVHLGVRHNATGRRATWHIPGAHYLESWGDVRSATGVLSIVQPMIQPLFGGWSELHLLLKLFPVPAASATAAAGGGAPAIAEDPGYTAVRDTFATLVKGDKELAWGLALRDGFSKGSKNPLAVPAAAPAALGFEASALADFPGPDAIEVVLTPSSHVWDGRFINNSWLQEVPDPISKLTWDNAALMSLATADALGVTHDGQLISIKGADGVSVEVPAFRLPGQADFTIQVELGYGQEAAGRVGEGTGFNVYPLLRKEGALICTGAKVERTGGKYALAPTAIHWSMEGRAIVRENTAAAYEEFVVKGHGEDWKNFSYNQGMDGHIPPNIPLYEGPDYFRPNKDQQGAPLGGRFTVDENHQWGMTIDLNTCIGCNACTIACQAENNIPVVGKEQVINGREMHWIRMDRYFSSPREKAGMTAQRVYVPEGRGRPAHDDDTVEMLTQPVACVHCEYAPCETVCPVNATVHSDDGLNSMAYNRCIGTRYCANNCPYKARRFNYFDYNKRRTSDFYLGPLAPAEGLGMTSLKLQKNPNVTVRMRGVIEKCTYCVQRLQSAKIDAKAKARDSRDVMVPTGSVTTACQDACPSRAISFGNLRDAKDPIVKLKEDPRNYDLLKYIGTRPRTSYLARVRNPNPKMPGAEHVGTGSFGGH
ncbi:MAG: prokaryotic molybdopterin-containing oxidoreductase family, iron-sulfur binding subunit [Verrucomicrobia bacterium]|nr:MAG: prokaryotic molybdopterin-containing oxidoreductase family, iron-sulfur binding subunit [Verrucomicrobiota bacterium]